MTEREAALDVLLAVLERGEYLANAVDHLLNQAEGSGQRQRFSNESMTGVGKDKLKQYRQYVKRVTKGVTERAIELDFRLNRIASQKVKRMHPAVRNILRLGAYELLYMDSIPAAASVNECVTLAKRRGQARAGGMVNAVLRKLAASAQAFEKTDLSVRYSMPEWITQRWMSRFGGEQTEEMLKAFLQEKPLTVRVNRSRISMEAMQEMFTQAGIRTERIGGLPAALVLHRGTVPITRMPGFAEGFFYIQDPGSMQVCVMADIRQGESVLDVCAAPGGKALHAADLAGENGRVEARDVSEQKVRRIEENVRRCRFSNISTKVWNAAVFDEDSTGKYDAVLADVPCSGLGVLGRKPEIKYRLTEQDILGLAQIQRDILECVHSYVKPGGRLVYSTCTISEAENEEQAADFLKRHTDFEKIAEKQFIPSTDAPGDGFYVCVMKRNG